MLSPPDPLAVGTPGALAPLHAMQYARAGSGVEIMKTAFTGAVAGGAFLFVAAAGGASAQNCRDQASLQSPPGRTQATEVTFVNTGVESRRIFWIDQSGKRKFYRELGPHASFPQPTFAGHVWVVAREDDRCQTVVIAVPRPMIVDVTRSCLTGRINDNGKCVE